MRPGVKLVVIASLILLVGAFAAACNAGSNSGQVSPQRQAAATPSSIKVDSLAVNPAEVNAGVDALISARVTNAGLSTEKYEGQVRIDNVSEPSLPTFLSCQLVNIPPGATQVVGVQANIINPGTYKVSLGGLSQNLVVNPVDLSAASSFDAAGSLALAPDFVGTDVVTGKKIALKDYRGSPVLLNFVNYGCNPQVNDIVSAQLLAIKKLKDQRNDFVPISVFCGCCPPEVLKQFAKDNNLNWPWILDSDNSIVAKYNNYLRRYGYPTLVFVSPDQLINEVTGAVSQTALNDKLNNLVKGSNLK